MGRYSWVATDMWSDMDFKRLPNIEKLLWMYLLTSPLSNSAGFYRLPPEYVQVALGEEARATLEKPSNLFKYDPLTEQVLLPNYLKYNTAHSSQQFKGINSAIRGLELCPLFGEFALCVNKWCKPEAFLYFDESIIKYLMLLGESETDPRKKMLLIDIYNQYISVKESKQQ